MTGRSTSNHDIANATAHQIRVHLQYLGYPIANDPLYSHENIWGSKIGKGGIELEPNSEGDGYHARALAARVMSGKDVGKEEYLADREYANIDITSPIRLSKQAKEVIAKLRKAKDEQEDWVKYVP